VPHDRSGSTADVDLPLPTACLVALSGRSAPLVREPFPAASSRPSGQKTAAPMPGLDLQQTHADGRLRNRNLQSGRSTTCRAGGHQEPAERL
jgi:hypothetical protein